MPEPTLDELRIAIDRIDRRLVKQINQRAELEIETLRAGEPRTPHRHAVDATSDHAPTLVSNPGPIPDTALDGVYREILNASFDFMEIKLW